MYRFEKVQILLAAILSLSWLFLYLILSLAFSIHPQQIFKKFFLAVLHWLRMWKVCECCRQTQLCLGDSSCTLSSGIVCRKSPICYKCLWERKKLNDSFSFIEAHFYSFSPWEMRFSTASRRSNPKGHYLTTTFRLILISNTRFPKQIHDIIYLTKKILCKFTFKLFFLIVILSLKMSFSGCILLPGKVEKN